MSEAAIIGSTSSSDEPFASGYRIKFNRTKFLELISEAKPRRVYKVKNFVFFAYDGFVMYCDQLSDKDLLQLKVFDAIEFSNVAWKKI